MQNKFKSVFILILFAVIFTLISGCGKSDIDASSKQKPQSSQEIVSGDSSVRPDDTTGSGYQSAGNVSSNETISRNGASSNNTSSAPEPNFIIYTETEDKVLFSAYVDFGGKTVGEVTLNVLKQNNIPYKSTGRGKMLYFNSIYSIAEFANGGSSGWCFYIRKSGDSEFVKSTVGCGIVKPNDTDILKWEYKFNAME